MTRPLSYLLVAAALAGCGKPGVQLVPVSGTVDLDGAPLVEGTVYFKTVATGAIEAFAVKDGKFSGNAEFGARHVEVTAYRSKPLKDDPMKGEIQESLVGPAYNIDSKLTATVTAEGPNTFKFDVRGK
ncbi:hypothetical protein [Gemmata sp.]|uniref:hypothetical protein n=1 Tax=Gemmata sp. TaxID=1914242 RepID=UPI003F71C98B